MDIILLGNHNGDPRTWVSSETFFRFCRENFRKSRPSFAPKTCGFRTSNLTKISRGASPKIKFCLLSPPADYSWFTGFKYILILKCKPNFSSLRLFFGKTILDLTSPDHFPAGQAGESVPEGRIRHPGKVVQNFTEKKFLTDFHFWCHNYVFCQAIYVY